MAIPRFWRETPSRYNLYGTRCGACDGMYFPPRAVCPACRSKSIGKMERKKLGGLGTVVTYAVVHDAPKDFEMQRPYIVAIVQLEEGPRITTPLIDVEPDEVEVGMSVEMAFRKLGEDGAAGIIHYGYKFRPRSATG